MVGRENGERAGQAIRAVLLPHRATSSPTSPPNSSKTPPAPGILSPSRAAWPLRLITTHSYLQPPTCPPGRPRTNAVSGPPLVMLQDVEQPMSTALPASFGHRTLKAGGGGGGRGGGGGGFFTGSKLVGHPACGANGSGGSGGGAVDGGSGRRRHNSSGKGMGVGVGASTSSGVGFAVDGGWSSSGWGGAEWGTRGKGRVVARQGC